MPRRRQAAALALFGLVLLATALRLVPIIFVPSVDWWDEIFQTIEPAHRLIYGYGLVPWEFQLGMRSWLLPGIVAGLIELSRIIGDGPDYYLPMIVAAFGLLASAPVVCVFLWARRWHGLAGAFVAAAAVAIAPELVYFGGRALNEVVAAHLLVIGCYLAAPQDASGSRWRLVAAGALLALVCLVRIQLAPAVAIIAVWSVWGACRERLPAILAGGAAALAGGAILDWLTLGYPLASIWRNVAFNLLYGVSADFGVESWSYYVRGEAGLWAAAGLFVVVLAALGARRLPVLLVAAITILFVHSGIAHKEYRFIYPAVLLVMVLAGIGLARLTDWATGWLGGRGLSPRTAVATAASLVLGYWAILAFAAWTGPTMTMLRQRAHDNLLATSFVSRSLQPCGLGLYGDHGYDWVWHGGYAYLHRPVPMYWPPNEEQLAAMAPAFDTLIYVAAPPTALGFKTVKCFGGACVAQRAGSCATRPMAAMPYPAPIAAMAPPPENFTAVPAALARAARP